MTNLPKEEARLREWSAQLDETLNQLRAEAAWQTAQPARRERIATACMAGIFANQSYNGLAYSDFVRSAVISADALIAELDKEVKP
jgi:hypothetical protein